MRGLNVLRFLFVTQVVDAIVGALGSAELRDGALASAELRDGALAVLGEPRVGRALAERGHAIVQLSSRAGQLRRHPGARLYASPDALPIGDSRLIGLIGFGLGAHTDWRRQLGEWTRAVVHRGVIVMVDRTPAVELTRRALCGGLADIQQRRAGRMVITSGRVTKL